MSWLKEAEEAESGRSHDYEFSWDYEVEEQPHEGLVALVDEVAARINSNVLPQIGLFQGFTIGYVKGLAEAGHLARFISGTESWPMIAVDLDSSVESAQKYGVDFDVAIESSIMHELGHAIEEAYDLGTDEDRVESFAHRYFKTGEVWKFWEER